MAIARRSWWPGWIWAVPIAAVGIVLWLLLRSISSRGIDVTVTYDEEKWKWNTQKVRAVFMMILFIE